MSEDLYRNNKCIKTQLCHISIIIDYYYSLIGISFDATTTALYVSEITSDVVIRQLTQKLNTNVSSISRLNMLLISQEINKKITSL